MLKNLCYKGFGQDGIPSEFYKNGGGEGMDDLTSVWGKKRQSLSNVMKVGS